MKRITKKLMAFALTAIMMLSMCVTAFADNTTKGSLTINNTTAGEEIKLYQMFSYADGDGTYTLVEDFEVFFTSDPKYGCTNLDDGTTVSNAAYSYILNMVNASERLEFAAEVKTWIDANSIVATKQGNGTDESTTVEDLTYGYYLVTVDGNDNAMLVDVTSATATINLKGKHPTIDKTVVEGEAEKEYATANIGDTITYKLESEVPDMAGYTAYTFKFIDTFSEGLTFNEESVEVKVAETELSASTDYTVTVDGQKVTIELNDFFAKYKDSAGAAIVVTYSATLNENAEVGVDPNTNQAYVEYSNNPDDVYSTATSTPDEVPVYVFDIIIDKYYDAGTDDGAHSPLEGAKFKLYTDKDCTEEVELVAVNEGTETDAAIYRVAAESETGVAAVTPVSGQLYIVGLDEGTYYLKETDAPSGFTRLATPIEVVIDVEINETTGELIRYTVKYNDITVEAVEGENPEKGTFPVIPVENKKGNTLPSTGGLGTVIFSIVGVGILLAMSASSIISKRRRNA